MIKHTILLLTLGLSGCAGFLQSDIAKTASDPKLTVLDCKPDKTSPPIATPQRAATLERFSATFASSSLMSQTDLQRGIALIRSSAHAGTTVSAEAAISASVANDLGLNLAQFAEDVAVLDDDGAAAAEDARESPAAASLLSLRSTDTASVSRADWQNFTQSLSRATATSGWTANFAKSLGAASQVYANSASSSGALDASLADVQKKYFLAVYMKAYFRNGQIFELKFDGQDLKTQLLNKLKQRITDQQALSDAGTEIDSVTKGFEAQLCGQTQAQSASCSILGVIGQETFVTRAGKSYGFPGVTATLDPVGSRKVSANKINADDVIEDLVRVFFEAAGDSLARVPGVANSTMCKEMNICASSAQAAAIEKVNNAGDATEASTTAVVSAVIRGGWLFSLNNEALAQSITTATSVTARKVAEEAAWKKASAGACVAPVTNGQHRQVTVKVTP